MTEPQNRKGNSSSKNNKCFDICFDVHHPEFRIVIILINSFEYQVPCVKDSDDSSQSFPNVETTKQKTESST